MAQAARNLYQVLVADFVSQCVVDGLEVVQVQQQQCAVLVVLGAGIERSLDALAQQASVGQAGQGVEVG